MRIPQPVSTSRPCGHCDGSGRCLCNQCVGARAAAKNGYGIEVLAPACGFCLGRKREQVEEMVLPPPGDKIRNHLADDRPKSRPPGKKKPGKGKSSHVDLVPPPTDRDAWEERKRRRGGV